MSKNGLVRLNSFIISVVVLILLFSTNGLSVSRERCLEIVQMCNSVHFPVSKDSPWKVTRNYAQTYSSPEENNPNIIVGFKPCGTEQVGIVYDCSIGNTECDNPCNGSSCAYYNYHQEIQCYCISDPCLSFYETEYTNEVKCTEKKGMWTSGTCNSNSSSDCSIVENTEMTPGHCTCPISTTNPEIEQRVENAIASCGVDNYTLDASCGYECNEPPEEEVETQCADGEDNDNDGVYDCNDSDCADSHHCNDELCKLENDKDLDGDGFFGCDDPECDGVEACEEEEPEEKCGNGIDDEDYDNKKDCEDSECQGNTDYCPGETSCSDKIDNDGNGKVDCCDENCYGKEGCPSVFEMTNFWGGNIVDCRIETPCRKGGDHDNDGIPDCEDADCASKWEEMGCASDGECDGEECEDECKSDFDE